MPSCQPMPVCCLLLLPYASSSPPWCSVACSVVAVGALTSPKAGLGRHEAENGRRHGAMWVEVPCLEARQMGAFLCHHFCGLSHVCVQCLRQAQMLQ